MRRWSGCCSTRRSAWSPIIVVGVLSIAVNYSVTGGGRAPLGRHRGVGLPSTHAFVGDLFREASPHLCEHGGSDILHRLFHRSQLFRRAFWAFPIERRTNHAQSSRQADHHTLFALPACLSLTQLLSTSINTLVWFCHAACDGSHSYEK